MKKLFFTFLSFLSITAFAKIKVATTTSDLAALVKEVGKDQVEVYAIAKGTQDPHLIEAKPSFMVKLRDADLLIAHGLDLESAWMVPLVQGARNPKLNSPDRIFQLGPKLDPIEVHKGAVSRADGDVHPDGNPHFQLDPIRMGSAALLVAAKLGEISPDQNAFFQKNAKSFQNQMEEKTKSWMERIKKAKTKEVVTYHKTFAYFCARFELKCTMQIEPKPGIPPSASHLMTVVDYMKKNNVGIVFIENVYEDTAGTKLKQSLPQIQVFHVPVSVEGESEIKTSADLFERLVSAIEKGSN